MVKNGAVWPLSGEFSDFAKSDEKDQLKEKKRNSCGMPDPGPSRGQLTVLCRQDETMSDNSALQANSRLIQVQSSKQKKRNSFPLHPNLSSLFSHINTI